MKPLLLMLCLLCACGRTEPSEDPIVSVDLGIKGLWTNPSNLTTAPSGALGVADDIDILETDIATPRPGYPQTGGSFGSSSSRMRSLAWYQGHLVGQYDSSAAWLNSGVWTSYTGTFAAPYAGVPPPFVVSQQTLFMSTASGVKALDDVTGQWVGAGVVRAIDIRATPTANANGFLAGDSNVAYRQVLGRNDAFGRVLLGSPSDRIIVSGLDVTLFTVPTGAVVRAANVVTVTKTAHSLTVGQLVLSTADATSGGAYSAGYYLVATVPDANHFTFNSNGANFTSGSAITFYPAASNVSLRLYLPPWLTTSHFVQLYRTRSTLSAEVDPGDEQQQAYERVLTNADITAGYVDAVDTTPDSVLGGYLYTNPNTGGGIQTAHDLPPVARCLDEYDGRVFYGCTTGPQRLTLQLIAANLLDVGDKLKIFTSAVANNYTAGSSESASPPTFKIYTAGSPSQNNVDTALSVIRAINGDASGLVSAYYASGPDDPPGLIALEERGHGGGVISAALAVGRAAVWLPALPVQRQVAIGGMVRVSNTVTVTTTTAHNGFLPGEQFYLLSSDPAFTSGAYTSTATPSEHTFEFVQAGPNGTSIATATVAMGDSIGYHFDTGFAGNALSWSEDRQPDAVPPANQALLGANDNSVFGVRKVGTSILIPTAAGLFRGAGKGGVYVFENRDPTLRFIAPRAVQVIANTMFALTTRGVVAITENGQARLVSDPINNLLPLNVTGAALANLNANGFATVQDSKNKYRLAVRFNGADSTVPSDVLVYNIKTQTWTREALSTTAGIADTDTDYFYVAGGQPPSTYGSTAPTLNVVGRDVRSGTGNDFANYVLSTASAGDDINGNQVLTPWVAVRVGDRYDTSTSGVGAVLEIVAQDSGSVTIRASGGMITEGDDVTIYGAIHSRLQWLPEQQGGPGVLKRLQEADVLWRRSPASSTLTTSTDFWPGSGTTGIETVTLPGVPGGGEGASVYKPGNETSLGNYHRFDLGIAQPLSAWELQGLRIKSATLRKTGR